MTSFKGYIQVYTGDGKGKTTAALGLTLRAAGNGMKTYIAQFMKKFDYSEVKALRKFLPEHVVIEQFGLPEFHTSGEMVTEKEREAALEGIDAVKRAIAGGGYDIIIMDEINILLYFKIIDIDIVLDIIDSKPPNIEFILTGRNAPQPILDRAHLVTEMKEIKHYYTQNIPARPGIEK